MAIRALKRPGAAKATLASRRYLGRGLERRDPQTSRRSRHFDAEARVAHRAFAPSLGMTRDRTERDKVYYLVRR
jgi:hypothetical protein